MFSPRRRSILCFACTRFVIRKSSKAELSLLAGLSTARPLLEPFAMKGGSLRSRPRLRALQTLRKEAPPALCYTECPESVNWRRRPPEPARLEPRLTVLALVLVPPED